MVDNIPDSGEIAILENDDPIAVALAGVGFVVDNVINADLDNGNGTQDYYGNTDPANNSFIFSSLTTNDVTETNMELNLYPNPAKEVIAIRGNIDQLDRVEIYSLNGQLVKTVQTDFDRISIAELEASVYLLRLYGENTSGQTLKLDKAIIG